MVWSKHGESPDQPIERDNSNSSNSDHDRMHEMLNDFGRQFDVGPEADARTMPKEVEEFYKLLAAAEEVLHESTKVTVLEAVTRLMSGKAKFNFSNECYNFIKMHLEADEYAQGEIDWIMKDPDARRWMCEHWAEKTFGGHPIGIEATRTGKPGMQRFGADGFVGKEQRMEAKLGMKPSFVDVWIEGHKGPDPENPEVLCDEQATEKLAKYKEKTLSQKLGGDVPEFRPPPQVFPQVPPNLFNAPINQGPPLGAPQGWVGPNAPEFRAPQFSPQVGPNYFVTTPTSQGSTGGEAQGSQPCNQLVQFGQGSQPQQWTYPTQGPTFGDASQSLSASSVDVPQ
ncbi:hypothetical protein U9M48_001946 [Paspalum notatum var. saurae]|uniref:Uncharacterized protein n=1 Tax=Paspalum notatum var. saurae TaxID=547442 RepID=A0AAQ3SH33_PASNO